MPWTKEDRSFKTLINKRTTDSTNKAWYNEFSDSTINVHGDELWVDSINSSPTQAVSDGVAELHTLFTLTLDGTVPNQQSYYAYDTTRLKDWISTKYGDDYQVHLFDNNNTEIFPTDACQWFFDYQTGILTFNGSTAAFSKPFKITAYRYIGAKGISGAGTSGTSGTSGINGTSGTSGINGNDGTSGTSGIDGTSGTSGIDGTSGTSGIDGTSGTSGIDGTSGTSGIDGTSGTSGIDGTSGTSGIDGTSGTSGIDGTSGTSGIDGNDGTSGTSGIDGTSGSSGTSGIDGTSGSSGTSGIDGTSGTSGIDGTSGTSGIDGTSGTSGIDGTSGSSGTSGIDGTSGTSGTSGIDGTSGTSGIDGTSGTSGVDGTSGTSGIDGTSGSSGTSGDGTSGTSGIDGTSGTSGLDGTSGTSGANGSPGTSGTSGTSGTAGSFSGDASDITIGELPSGESWDDGLLPFSEGDSVQSTIYDINTILTLIAPAKPGLLTSQALTLSGTTKYSAKLPSGLGTAWYGDGAEAGDTITDYVIDNIFRVTSPDSTTRFYVGLVDNPQGVLNLVRDGSTLDSYDVSLGAGSSTMLTVSDVSTYNSVWTKANAYADITQSDEGYRGYTFSHPLAGTTSTTAVRYDNVASTPSFSSTLSIAENSKVSKYLSGIEYYGQNSTFNISYTAASGIFQKCYHPTAVATVSQNVAAFASFNQNPASTPAYNDTFAVSSYTVTMSVANKSSNSPSITVTLNKPDGKTATSTANLTKGLCTYGTVSTTTADSFYDEAQRLVLDTDTAWTSSSALTTGNAQVRNGTLQYPNSTEYPGFSGNQEYQRKITKASASTGTITLTGLTYSNISPYGTGSINVLFQLDTDGVFFDLGRVVGDNNGDGSGDSRANSKGARVSGSGYVVSWSLGTYSTADNNSQYRVIIIFRNTTYSITAIASA